VVVLTNSQPWGGRSTIERALARLGPDRRLYVRVAPDPADPDEAARLRLTERPTLGSADRVTRLFKYFAGYADLIVTVEGWLGHFAYSLGRAFRLFLAAGSFGPDWVPHGRGRSQRVVPSFSVAGDAAHALSALLGDDDSPPLPHRPRKTLLEVALRGLGRAGGAGSVAPLRRALTSPDSDVRTWAVAALGRLDPPLPQKTDLLVALADRSATVVREAADALLRARVDCSHELGPRYRELIQAHADAVRQHWDAVARVGPAALPVLFRAAESEIDGSEIDPPLEPELGWVEGETSHAFPVEDRRQRAELRNQRHGGRANPEALGIGKHLSPSQEREVVTMDGKALEEQSGHQRGLSRLRPPRGQQPLVAAARTAGVDLGEARQGSERQLVHPVEERHRCGGWFRHRTALATVLADPIAGIHLPRFEPVTLRDRILL
jgi:hypothetical protein